MLITCKYVVFYVNDTMIHIKEW